MSEPNSGLKRLLILLVQYQIRPCQTLLAVEFLGKLERLSELIPPNKSWRALPRKLHEYVNEKSSCALSGQMASTVHIMQYSTPYASVLL